MPIVPQYQSGVQQRPIFQQSLTTRATADDMGAATGRGMQGLAQGIGDAANAMRQVQELEDVARAKEADNQFAAWLRERQYGEGGFLTLQGRAAVDARAEFEADVADARQRYGQGLTPGAQQSYATASNARLNSALEQSIIHTANSRKQWYSDASTARLNTFSEDAVAAYADPEKIEFNIAAGQAEIRQQAEMFGWDADTQANREAEYISEVRLNTALRMLADDPAIATSYYEQHKQQFTGPHQFQFEEAAKIPMLGVSVQRNTAEFFDNVVAPAASDAASVIRGFEGFRTEPYWDVNAYRIGYGSDTITRADGTVVKVTQGMTVTRADAERDLARRINQEFVPGIIRDVGAENWSRLPAPAQAALASIAYNYGSLPFRVANAVVMGDLETIATEVEALKGHNEGVNADRRMQEAAIIRGMSGAPMAVAASQPAFSDIESYLSGIADPTEREMTRKAIYAQLEARQKAAAAQQEALQTQAFNLIETQNISPFELPPEVTTAIGMDGMSSLMTYWEKRASGQEIQTDPTVLYNLQTMYAQNPAEFAKVDLFQYKSQLSPQDWKEVTGWRQTALTDQRRAREDGLSLTTAFSQASAALEGVGITTVGKDGTARADAAARVAQFNNALAQQMAEFKAMNEGRNPNQMEIQSMINRLLLPVVIKEPSWSVNPFSGFQGESVINDQFLFETGTRSPTSEVSLAVPYAQIPTNARVTIIADLEAELGRRPTDEEVAQRYNEFLLEQIVGNVR